MKPIATKSEHWEFNLCSINLKVASISGTGNVQPILNLDPCVMKHLWCDTIDSSINYFLVLVSLDLVLNKPPQEKNEVLMDLDFSDIDLALQGKGKCLKKKKDTAKEG